jgi:hypothetical protein
MTREMQMLLNECLRREEALKATPPPDLWKWWVRERYDDEMEYGPVWAPSEWFGDGLPLSDAQRMKFVRVLHELGGAGLLTVTRGPDGRRIAHVKLTDEGRRQAASMLSARV